MFRQYVKDRLEKVSKGEPGFLLIGENHEESSALIGLAHCLPDIVASGKKVIVITESLDQQKGMFGREKSYSEASIKNVKKEYDRNFDPMNALVKSGVVIYGLENERTAPSKFLKAKTKEALVEEAKMKLPYLFNDQKVLDDIKHELRDPDPSVYGLRYLFDFYFAYSTQRMTEANDEVVEKMSKFAKNAKDTLIIFTGGVSHLSVSMNHDTNQVIHVGVQRALEEKFGNDRVGCCFFSSKKATSENGGYMPLEGKLECEIVPNHLQVPYEFLNPGSENDKRYQENIRLGLLYKSDEAEDRPLSQQANILATINALPATVPVAEVKTQTNATLITTEPKEAVKREDSIVESSDLHTGRRNR